ncbi:hypothetical protein ACTXT7_008534 [Hymenolepis weldensis]
MAQWSTSEPMRSTPNEGDTSSFDLFCQPRLDVRLKTTGNWALEGLADPFGRASLRRSSSKMLLLCSR